MIEMCLAYLRARVRTTVRNEVGASLVEYALLLALIAAVCVTAVTVVGQKTQSNLSSSASLLD